MSNNNNKTILIQGLAQLLGFDDGADDVLEHLLTIDNKDDLIDYLSQLLGKNDEPIKQFVQNIENFRNGKDIIIVSSAQQQQHEDNIIPSNEQCISTNKVSVLCSEQKSASTKQKQTKLLQQQQQQQQKSSVKKAPPSKKNKASKQQTTNNVSTKKKSPDGTLPKKVDAESTSSTYNNDATATTTTTNNNNIITPETPLRGKAKLNCGCFGNLHKALTNCLYCGRILCEQEGYGYCPFCGYMIEQYNKQDINNNDNNAATAAYIHKERLLKYDREFAQRTVIIDDQADYYNNQTSNWLTQDEQNIAKQQEQQRHNELHRKQKMKIQF